MKKIETNSGTVMVSDGVELDTEDMFEEEEKGTVEQVKELLEKLIPKEKDSLENYTQSSCIITFKNKQDKTCSGKLERFHYVLENGYSGKTKTSFVFWVTYDELINTREVLGDVKKLYLQYYKDRVDEIDLGGKNSFMEEYEISEIRGPLFKLNIKYKTQA
jgi:hypothetical protein